MKEYLVTVVYRKCDVYETYIVESKTDDIESMPDWVDKVLSSDTYDEDIEFGEGPYIVQVQENV